MPVEGYTLSGVKQISLEEAQANLPDIIHRLASGDEIVITEGQRTVARLIGGSGGDGRIRKTPAPTAPPTLSGDWL